MSHLKCTPCRIRAYASPLAAVADAEVLCPGCGRPLEPARSADELIGFRMVEPPVAEGAADVAVAAALLLPSGS